MIGYLRVSTEEQATTGGGLAAQRARIEAEQASNPAVRITRWLEDDASGKTLRRPAIQEALALLDTGEEDGLVVAHLDRMSRSVYDAAGLIEQALRRGWALVTLDHRGLDMTTPYGKAMAQMAWVFAELERELISQRTRDGMQALIAEDRAAGRPSRFGRAVVIEGPVVDRVQALSRRGVGVSEIARRLNRDGFLNTAGNPWAPGSVSALLARLRRAA